MLQPPRLRSAKDISCQYQIDFVSMYYYCARTSGPTEENKYLAIINFDSTSTKPKLLIGATTQSISSKMVSWDFRTGQEDG